MNTQSAPSPKKKKQFSKNTSASPNNESRNAKRARWAKKNKPVAKPIVKRGPEHEYISACCSVPARKPRAGAKEAAKDAESGRMKDKVKGLGHWRCGQCGKVCKVTPRKPETKPMVTFVPPALEALVSLAVLASFPEPPKGVIARMVTFDGPDMGRGTEVTDEKFKTEVVNGVC